MGTEPRQTSPGEVSSAYVQHDFAEHQTATIAVVEAVTGLSGTEPTELPPLYDAIDPEALDTLFTSHETRAERSALRIEFSYHGYSVVLEGGPKITIRRK